jgi:dienelactone hydrolase
LKPKKIKSFYLRNLFNNRIAFISYSAYIISLFAICLPENITAQVIRKSKINFNAADSLLVTADVYQSRKSNPYVILLHQEESSRGEFDSIASRFIKMNYNCMAVDLRSGNNRGFVKNETALRAREAGYSFSLIDASIDIDAAIDFLYHYSGKKISLFGSKSSATLALIAGRDNDHVKAVIAFSPGEYFSPEFELKNVLSNYPKPVFIACTDEEYLYLSDIEGLSGNGKILFKPASGGGASGTNALMKENPSRDEYWLSLLIFFKSLQ